MIGVRALKQKQYALARQNFAQSVRGPVTDLAATLLAAWALAGAGRTHNAVDTLDRLTGPDWYAIFKDLHAGLILDLAGRNKDAGRRLELAYKVDGTALRVVQAYGSWASRNELSEEALKIFKLFEEQLPQHPLITSATDTIKKGGKLPPV